MYGTVNTHIKTHIDVQINIGIIKPHNYYVAYNINQLINQTMYSARSRSLLRGACKKSIEGEVHYITYNILTTRIALKPTENFR